MSPLDGQILPVYNLNPALRANVDRTDFNSSDSNLRNRTYNGVQLGFNARLGGAQFFGGWTIDDYVDEAEGVLEKGADGKVAMTRVTLKPRIEWQDEGPDPAALADLHHKAHEACFIANSVKTEVVVEQ